MLLKIFKLRPKGDNSNWQLQYVESSRIELEKVIGGFNWTATNEEDVKDLGFIDTSTHGLELYTGEGAMIERYIYR